MRLPIIALLFTARLAADTGSQEFAARCAACHGGDGRGGERAPAIVLRSRSVSFAEIVDPKPGDWPTYHGRLGGNRHSLAPKWMFPIKARRGFRSRRS